MLETGEIIGHIRLMLGRSGRLAGKKIVVTAGGTREPIDPVRYVGNRSSGKMGHAIAVEAAERGAQVTLVTTAAPSDHPRIRVVEVATAEEMAEAVWSRTEAVDVAVLAAAVADFRPKEQLSYKVRRVDGPPVVDLVATPDILAGVASSTPRPFLVGFAAEAGPVEAARAKLAKGVDLLVANDVTAPDSGFGSETNQVTLFFPDGDAEGWPSMPKQKVASKLWERIVEMRAKG